MRFNIIISILLIQEKQRSLARKDSSGNGTFNNNTFTNAHGLDHAIDFTEMKPPSKFKGGNNTNNYNFNGIDNNIITKSSTLTSTLSLRFISSKDVNYDKPKRT